MRRALGSSGVRQGQSAPWVGSMGGWERVGTAAALGLASALALAGAGCSQGGGDSGDGGRGGSGSNLLPIASNGGSGTDGDGPDGGPGGGSGGGPSVPVAGNAPVNDPDAGMEEPFVVPPTPEKAEPCDVIGCPPGLECAADGICVTPPPACLEDADCGADQHCGLTGDCLDPGGCVVTGDCGMAEACRAGVCTMGSDCGQTELTIDPIPANVLVLLDISLSMNDTLDPANCQQPNCRTKMQIASQTITQMTVTYATDINWGLAMFPGPNILDGCALPMNVIAPAAGNGPAVSSAVMAALPGGFTPIYGALNYVQTQGYLDDPMLRDYLLFISDGGETCGGDNAASEQIIANLAAMGIPTFVVGFGSGVDPAVLNRFALAGGVPNTSGGTDYFQADSAAELEAALGDIFQRVSGCDFSLQSPPDDPDMVWAFLDDLMVERDTDDGWVLDTAANQVSFVGASCVSLQAGEVRDIDIVFGCPEPVLE